MNYNLAMLGLIVPASQRRLFGPVRARKSQIYSDIVVVGNGLVLVHAGVPEFLPTAKSILLNGQNWQTRPGKEVG